MIEYINKWQDRDEVKAMYGLVELLEKLLIEQHPDKKLGDDIDWVCMFEGHEVNMYLKMMKIYETLENMK